MYQDDTETGPRGVFEEYRAEGDTLCKNGEYNKAIESYTTALEIRKNDKDCLVARSRCYLQMGNTELALKDAEASLAEDANFYKGLFQKAEAFYCKGEFELSLVFYHRGHKMRPELQEFRLGIQKAQEAIDNSVGSPERVKLTKDGDLSFFDVLNEPAKKPRAKGNYARTGTRSRNKQTKEIRSAVNDKTVKQLLGELYGDRIYMEKLLKETNKQSSTGKDIYNLVQAGIHYLDTRTDFWRQQKPMYARKRDRIIPRTAGRKETKDSANQYVIKELERIDEDTYEGRYDESLVRAKNCVRVVEGYKTGLLDNKESVIANLHSLMGNAYLEQGELDKALYHHTVDMDMARMHKLKEARGRALDNLGRVYARRGDFLKAVETWQTKLPLAKTPLELTWLHHEMGRCYLEMGQYIKAKELGEKSGVEAEKANDSMWQLNAAVLVAQAQAKLKEFESSLESFERALDLANLQGDESAGGAIKRAIQDINNKIVQGIKTDNTTNSPPPPSDDKQSPSEKSASPEPRSESTDRDQGDNDSGSTIESGSETDQ